MGRAAVSAPDAVVSRFGVLGELSSPEGVLASGGAEWNGLLVGEALEMSSSVCGSADGLRAV